MCLLGGEPLNYGRAMDRNVEGTPGRKVYFFSPEFMVCMGSDLAVIFQVSEMRISLCES